MAINIFGFDIKRAAKEDKTPPSPVAPSTSDGSLTVSNLYGLHYGMSFDILGGIQSENQLIQKYRTTAEYSDVDSAIEDIVNEAVVSEGDMVTLNLDEWDVSDALKERIIEQFDVVLNLLGFREGGHDLFRTWYVDGRLYFNVIVDQDNPEKGVLEFRYIDPQKIRKIKSVKTDVTPEGVEVQTEIGEYYIYNDKGITESGNVQGVRLSVDSVVYVPSGLVDPSTGIGLSNLHKALKPTNQLKMVEDSLVIYRISRAPERRVFYVDVGSLPKVKAEQYVNDLMNKYRNKIIYDPATGEVQNNRQHLSLQEDFWMPRRDGGKGTEITTLQGGQNLNDIADINYFQHKLYQSLNVPISRLEPNNGFSLGRTTEITRDEVKFSKFISRLRSRFNTLFLEALKIQLVLKNIVSIDDWESIKPYIQFDYEEDNHFAELKDAEIIQSRLGLLGNISPYIGHFVSKEWVMHNVLQLNDQEIAEMNKQIKSEEPPVDTSSAPVQPFQPLS